MRHLFFIQLAALLCTSLVCACSDNDTFTTSPTATLTFSKDTVLMDTVFATVGSRTYDLWVFNHSRSGVRLQSVRLRQGNQTGFRVNVDGSFLDNATGAIVGDLEVRKGDSIRVFVELTAPENGQLMPQLVADELLFRLESGVEQRVVLQGYAWDALQWRDTVVVSRDSLIESRKPIIIYSGLRVDSTATLTICNTTLFFHDKAGIDVMGTIVADSAVFRGDRLDHMFDYLPYDHISGQWRGIRLCAPSFGNRFVASEIRNAEYGIVCDSTTFVEGRQKLYMEGTVIHNCKGHGLQSFNSTIGLLRCQLTNTEGDCLAIHGGVAVVDHCTLAQFYPFSASRGAALRFTNFHNTYPYPLHALQMSGSIVTGYADDVVMGQTLDGDSTTLFNYYFENTLLRTPATEDTVRFVGVRWETPDDSIQGKQHFRLIDEKNLIYDFHLDSLSTVQGLGCY